jgi:hypothetical protein
MVHCAQCGRELDGTGTKGSLASISGEIMGDGYTDSYYFCGECAVYTVKVCHDRFLGEEETSIGEPLSKTEGDEKVRQIGECSEPWNKKCRCRAHRAYFGGWLD